MGNCPKLFAHSFSSLTRESAALLDEYFRGYDYGGAYYTRLGNEIWNRDYDLLFEEIGDYMVLTDSEEDEDHPGEMIGLFSIPLTKTGAYDPVRLAETLREVVRRYRSAGMRPVMENIPKSLGGVVKEALGSEIELVEDRDGAEYVYEKEKLITLSGRALHKRKNHLNYFLKTYEYEAEPIREDMLPDIVALTRSIRDRKDRSTDEIRSLDTELHALEEMMKHLDEPNLYTCVIRIDGAICACAIGERLNRDTAVQHFEKADVRYRGLYQAICREFCRTLPDDIVFVNREEDMGIPNLRHAKEALRPHHMSEKYMGYFRD